MFLIKRSEADDNDDSDWKIRMWWWWYFDANILMMMMLMFWWCFWSKDQSMMMMLLLIKRPKCWRRCCRSRGQSIEDVDVDQKVKVMMVMLLMLLIVRSEYDDDDDAIREVQILKNLLLIKTVRVLLLLNNEDWRWRLHDVEKLPMIYRCVTLMMLMMLSLSCYCCCCRIPFLLRGSVEIL